MKCPNCQGENPGTAKFCNSCGARMETPQAQTSLPAGRKKRGRGKIVIMAVGAAVVLCVLVAVLASLGGGGDKGATPTAARAGEVVQPTDAASAEAQVQITASATTGSPTDTPAPTSTPGPTKTRRPTQTPRTPKPTATFTAVPTDTPVPPTKTPKPPTATPNPDLVRPGTYLVGADIQPGIYRGEAGADIMSSCYWARLKDLAGGLDSTIANDNAMGRFYVEVRSSDFAFETRCKVELLRSLPEPPAEFPLKVGPGTYLVGLDIRPGTYKGQAGADIMESCYWGRLRDVAGDMDSTIANDNAIGQYFVQVQQSDFALETRCELERIGD